MRLIYLIAILVVLPTFTILAETMPATQPATAPANEAYAQIDLRKLKIDIRIHVKNAWMENGGEIMQVNGSIKKFSVAGNDIALTSAEMDHTDGKATFQTRDYGQVRLTFNSDFTCNVWLTESQVSAFKKLGDK